MNLNLIDKLGPKTEKILLAISGIEYISFEWYEARHLMPADLIFSTAKKSFSENNSSQTTIEGDMLLIILPYISFLGIPCIMSALFAFNKHFWEFLVLCLLFSLSIKKNYFRQFLFSRQ